MILKIMALTGFKIKFLKAKTEKLLIYEKITLDASVRYFNIFFR